jgi:hypothetical protein
VKNTIKSTEEIVSMLCAGEQECVDEVLVSPGDYEEPDLLLWIVSVRQRIQRVSRRRQKELLKLPFVDDDIEATRFPLRSHCPRCWISDDVLNRNVTLAYIELEFGRSLW